MDDNCDDVPDDGFDCIMGEDVSCTTMCFSTGTGTCTDDCDLPASTSCNPPEEECNGLDDDCVDGPDNGFECVKDEEVSCTTTCGSAGTGSCMDDCSIPGGLNCSPPEEECNGLDDDCVEGPDNGFPCVKNQPVPCTTTCESIGEGICTSDCSIPEPEDCDPPDETCNGEDDDCDTVPDNGVSCAVGNPCTGPEECDSVPSESRRCVTVLGGYYRFPNGYCSAICTTPDECGEGASCVPFFGFGYYCLKICTGPEECRSDEGYQCSVVPGDSSCNMYFYPS